jgi:hypothetical protein
MTTKVVARQEVCTHKSQITYSVHIRGTYFWNNSRAEIFQPILNRLISCQHHICCLNASLQGAFLVLNEIFHMKRIEIRLYLLIANITFHSDTISIKIWLKCKAQMHEINHHMNTKFILHMNERAKRTLRTHETRKCNLMLNFLFSFISLFWIVEWWFDNWN